jgi:LPS-assembly protein
LQFERNALFFGRDFVQTLEPRAFYVYTPYRNQSLLPNYDSAENSFSFASLFAENSFIGQDRISDANLLTLGAVSRLLQPETGAESVRLGVAQRIRFADQRVTLLGGSAPVNAERLSDVLLSSTLNWNSQWALNLNTQYNPKLGESQRSSLSARYSPSFYRVLSTSYKRQRPLTPTDAGSQQVDLGWQWPLNDLWGERGQDLGAGQGQGGRRWYSVGRLNYSMTDRKLVDSVVGFEYDGCCWIGRAVLQRSTSGTTSTNTQLMFQLEFLGFSRIGNNPLSVLRTNVPRYQLLRDQVSLPSRFTNYE